MSLQDYYQSVIDHFGNQVKTATMLGVRQASVSAWVSGKTKMGAAVAIRAEKVTQGKFKASDLCPALRTVP